MRSSIDEIMASLDTADQDKSRLAPNTGTTVDTGRDGTSGDGGDRVIAPSCSTFSLVASRPLSSKRGWFSAFRVRQPRSGTSWARESQPVLGGSRGTWWRVEFAPIQVTLKDATVQVAQFVKIGGSQPVGTTAGSPSAVYGSCLDTFVSCDDDLKDAVQKHWGGFLVPVGIEPAGPCDYTLELRDCYLDDYLQQVKLDHKVVTKHLERLASRLFDDAVSDEPKYLWLEDAEPEINSSKYTPKILRAPGVKDIVSDWLADRSASVVHCGSNTD